MARRTIMDSAKTIDPELEAINDIIQSLKKVPEDRQGAVLDFVIQRMGIALPSKSQRSAAALSQRNLPTMETALTTEVPRMVSIRDLREGKNPKTDVQMAVLVAYYLSELAPSEERKDTIQIPDITKYFKQAGYPIPPEPRFTLNNAKNGGYLDSVSAGEYRLNPVGYNLVVHAMPRRGEIPTRKAKTRKKGKTKKK